MRLYLAGAVRSDGIGPRRPVHRQPLFCGLARAGGTRIWSASPCLLNVLIARPGEARARNAVFQGTSGGADPLDEAVNLGAQGFRLLGKLPCRAGFHCASTQQIFRASPATASTLFAWPLR